MITAARVSAIASLKLKHVNLDEGSVFQDPREVNAKFQKAIMTYLVDVAPGARAIFEDWVTYLREEKLWGLDDPLFPAPVMSLDGNGLYQVSGIDRVHWATTEPIRAIFR